MRRTILSGALLFAGGMALFAPTSARAHFVLDAPASWMSQSADGLPEKLGPCGNEAGGTPTGIVTALHPGETITVTIDEKIFHPGHYRIALAPDQGHLPPEPPVDAGSTPCGSVPIESPPVFPVLADGVFLHTAPFTSPQSIKVTLPADFTCDKCTLQVIEFMSDHALNNPGGCFYHHCADLSIKAGQDADGSAGSGGGLDDAGNGSGGTGSGGAGGSGDGATSSSGGCALGASTSATGAGLPLAGLVAIAAFVRRRRRA